MQSNIKSEVRARPTSRTNIGVEFVGDSVLDPGNSCAAFAKSVRTWSTKDRYKSPPS